jgi:hypothetical protein
MIANPGTGYGANTLLDTSAPLRLCGEYVFLLGFIPM